jgi:hypothetical protein
MAPTLIGPDITQPNAGQRALVGLDDTRVVPDIVMSVTVHLQVTFTMAAVLCFCPPLDF